jgi:hypothetical protein
LENFHIEFQTVQSKRGITAFTLDPSASLRQHMAAFINSLPIGVTILSIALSQPDSSVNSLPESFIFPLFHEYFIVPVYHYFADILIP